MIKNFSYTFDELIYYKFLSKQYFWCKSKRKPKYKVIWLDDVEDYILYRLFDLETNINKLIPNIYDFIIKDYNIKGYISIKFDNYLYFNHYELSDAIKSVICKNYNIDQCIKDKTRLYNNSLTNTFISNPDKYFDKIDKEKSLGLDIYNTIRKIYPWIYRKNRKVNFPKLNKQIILDQDKFFEIQKIKNYD